MIELIDIDGNIKFMATIITGLKYGDDFYVLYSIKRDKEYDNLFISKLVNNSTGYVMDNSFSSGEKEAMDDVVRDILNKDSVDKLKEKGLEFISDVSFNDVNRFSVTNCYVTSYKRELLNDCINYYNFSINDKKPEIIVKEKKVSYFSKSNRPSVYLILLGILVVIISIIMIINI